VSCLSQSQYNIYQEVTFHLDKKDKMSGFKFMLSVLQKYALPGQLAQSPLNNILVFNGHF
jgi:hypothetical protein